MRRFVLPLPVAGLLLAATAATAAAPPNTCVFTMSMTSGDEVNNLDFTVNYAAVGGNVEGTPTRPECVRALGGTAFAGFHDDDANSKLTVAMIRLTHFSAPVDLAACRIFYDTTPPIPENFSINVTNAGRDGDDTQINPLPVIAVTDVECPGDLPSATTTTTLPGLTTTTLPVTDGRCGLPSSDGDTPAASDALFALKAAVGGSSCALCVCDINSSGSITAGDALGILRAAVGIPTTLDCPPC